MTFSAAATLAFRNASAAESADALAGGDLDLLNAGGAVLASVDLGTPTASGAVVTMGGFPKTTAAVLAGDVASARYRTIAGGDWKTGMTVGLSGSGAQVILTSLSLALGQSVQVNSATLTHGATAA